MDSDQESMKVGTYVMYKGEVLLVFGRGIDANDGTWLLVKENGQQFPDCDGRTYREHWYDNALLDEKLDKSLIVGKHYGYVAENLLTIIPFNLDLDTGELDELQAEAKSIKDLLL